MCVSYFPRTRIRVGEHVLSQDPDCDKDEAFFCNETPQDFNVAEIIAHESYNSPNPFQHDIALVKLDRPAKFGGNVYEPFLVSEN